jgi:4-diphosphocytidyl-2-C-methyl-D-erythritol kinase
VTEDPDVSNTTAYAAPAKINLFLRVLGRRDDGYHELETLVLPIGLGDRVHVHAGAGEGFRTLSLSLSVVEGRPGMARGVPLGESNLVIRAAKELADHVGVRGFAEITLEKQVPSAAGLGGGSSDAASTLRALNELWGCGLAAEDLRAVAAGVGSDVPALLAGGPVVARGRGERVEPVGVPPLGLLLVTFDFGVSTRDAFAWWDQDGAVTGPDPARLLTALAEATQEDPGDAAAGLSPLLFNDLRAPVVRRHPVIAEVLQRLTGAGASTAILCGSGPSVAALFPPGAQPDPAVVDEVGRIAGPRPLWVSSPPPPDAGQSR